jgi:branched-subunit amino acid ABC-type transport system permease component
MGSIFTASLIDGLLIGFVYGIAAMGLSLIWGVMDVINLAHAPLIALGMFGVYLLFNSIGLNPYLALILIAVMGLIGGILIYYVAIHRVLSAPPLSTLLATYAVNMVMIGLGTAAFSTTPRNVNFSLGSLGSGVLTVQGTRLVAAILATVITGALYLFLYRTRPGKNIRAVANNRSAAELMGIPSSRVLAISFGLGTLLAAVAGGLIATFFPFTILAGNIYQLKSFVIVVLGGLGNPIGSLLGGLILGVMEGLIPLALPNSWVPVLEFLLFVIILLVRPTGLFGAKK